VKAEKIPPVPPLIKGEMKGGFERGRIC